MNVSVVARAARRFATECDHILVRFRRLDRAIRSRLAVLGLAAVAVNAAVVLTGCWPNPPEVLAANLSLSNVSGSVPLKVTASASGSSGLGTLSYRFDFGDGTVVGPQQGITAVHTYTKAGTFQVTLTVSDSVPGHPATATKSVTAYDAPTPHISASATTSQIGDCVTLTATGAVGPVPGTAAVTYTWTTVSPDGWPYRIDDSTVPTYPVCGVPERGGVSQPGTWTYFVEISDAAGAYRQSNSITITWSDPAGTSTP